MKRSETYCPFCRGLIAAAAGFAVGLAVVWTLLALQYPRPTTSRETIPAPIQTNREAVRRSEEAYLAQRIVNILKPLIGERRIQAEIRLEIDYDTVRSSEEIFDPDGQVLRSYTAAANFASEAEYEINKYSRSVIKNGGRIKRLSALVLVDSFCNDGTCRELGRGELARLASIIAPVIGFEPRRGDSLQIENISFANGKTNAAEQFELALLAGSCALLVFLWLRYRRRESKTNDVTPKSPEVVWKKLENTDAETLAAYLTKECPAAAAYVLLRLNQQTAAAVLAMLPLDFAAETLAAMATAVPTAPEIAEEIEKTLSRDFAHPVQNGRERAFQLFAAAGNRRQELLGALETDNPVLAGRLRATMFNFEDFSIVGNKDIRRLFDEVEAERLAVALRGASEKLKQHFFANMSPDAVAFVQKEMTTLGPVKLKDVEAAQNEIIEQASKLAAAGKICLKKTNGERI